MKHQGLNTVMDRGKIKILHYADDMSFFGFAETVFKGLPTGSFKLSSFTAASLSTNAEVISDTFCFENPFRNNLYFHRFNKIRIY